MARKENSEKNLSKKSRFSILKNLKEETLQGVVAVMFFVIAIFLILSSFDKAGFVGTKIYFSLHWLVGIGYYLFPILFILLSISYLRSLKREFDISKIAGGILFLLSALGIIEIVAPNTAGKLGSLIVYPLVSLFDVYASLIFLVAFFVISMLIMFDTELKISWLLFWKKLFNAKKDEDKKNQQIEPIITSSFEDEKESSKEEIKNKQEKNNNTQDNRENKQKKLKVNIGIGEDPDVLDFPKNNRKVAQEFIPIPLSLLERDKGKPGVGDIKANANIIKRTLQNFGIEVEMDEVSIGPSITRYALKPAEGVKLSKIVGLNNDLALSLAAHPIRIEAPIPGKSLVGIEIPNTVKATVGLANLLSNEEYQNSEKPLLVALGKGISGKSHFANMAKMPHLLIAGATGSGKSVTIHAIITSLLFRNSPEDLKFIMIDPKRVELTLYNGIPQLLTPVVTDAKKAILSLRWAAKEMDRRYDILEKNSVRDIDSYHKNILNKNLKIKNIDGSEEIQDQMPYIVIVIDELADIMQSYPRELEAAIVRLAQMSRAVGIHLILSTQRPSVNVITGLIKANVPARIALQVSSQIDSRTILDTSGAEKLLGAGDMLYISGEMGKPSRIQSAFISETEVKNIVKFLKQNYEESIPTDINTADKSIAIGRNNEAGGMKPVFDSLSVSDNDNNESLEDDDEMYETAKEEVEKAGKASTSYIQRKLRIGYARAARIMDILEERGVIGPADGARPREVLSSKTEESVYSEPQDEKEEAV